MTEFDYELALDEQLVAELLNEWNGTEFIEGLFDDLPDTDLYGNSFDEPEWDTEEEEPECAECALGDYTFQDWDYYSL